MKLANLKEHAEFVPLLAGWHHAQWGELNPQRTLASRVEALQRHLSDEPIPVTFVAIEDGAPIGSASLVERDLATHVHLSPWLASVYVAPAHRRQGIGGQLVRRIVGEAAALNVGELFLFTLDQERFYRDLGWKVIEYNSFNGHPITVMMIEPIRA
jgi:predicted N-acetyltransferase YhbS